MADSEFVAEAERKFDVPWKDQKGDTVYVRRRFVWMEDGKVKSEDVENYEVPRTYYLAQEYSIWMRPDINPARAFNQSGWIFFLKLLGGISDGGSRKPHQGQQTKQVPLFGQPFCEFVQFNDPI